MHMQSDTQILLTGPAMTRDRKESESLAMLVGIERNQSERLMDAILAFFDKDFLCETSAAKFL